MVARRARPATDLPTAIQAKIAALEAGAETEPHRAYSHRLQADKYRRLLAELQAAQKPKQMSLF
jgi:hypothetical protein